MIKVLIDYSIKIAAAHFNLFISILGFFTATKTTSLCSTDAAFKLQNHCWQDFQDY